VDGGGLERRPLVVQKGLDGFAEVFNQMKAIHDLHGLRFATAYAIGIERTPVSTDHGNGGMLREPGGHALSRALGQEVQDLMVLQIDQDGPIAVPAPPGPLIDPNTLWGGGGRRRRRLHQPQQGVWTNAQSQPGREPCPSLPAEGQTVGKQELGQPEGPSRPRRRHGRQAFRKNLAWARGMVTEKLAYLQLHTYAVGAPRQIGEGAGIPAVDPRGPYVAERAGHTGLGRGHVERDRGGSLIDVPRLQGQGRLIW
jgi:hypothetical protein